MQNHSEGQIKTGWQGSLLTADIAFNFKSYSVTESLWTRCLQREVPVRWGHNTSEISITIFFLTTQICLRRAIRTSTRLGKFASLVMFKQLLATKAKSRTFFFITIIAKKHTIQSFSIAIIQLKSL